MSPRRRKTDKPQPTPVVDEPAAVPVNTPTVAQPTPPEKAVDENDAAMAAALEEVIVRLQHLMRETMQRADDEEKFSILADYMEKFSRASTRLAVLLKTQQEVAQAKGKKSKMQVAMDEVLVSMGKKVE